MSNQSEVSLVIPGRDCAATLRACLDSLVPLLGGDLAEIVFVDDGSVDETPEIARSYPVRYVRGEGAGPGAARNLGWREAKSPLIWFVDSDCVANEDALRILLGHMADPKVAGAGGSYGNMRPDSLLACLIHEEIVSRHDRMPHRVDFLATFNVVYRRAVLEELRGFDERFVTAEDADFAFRAREAGFHLAFDSRSKVAHHHPAELRRYMRTQYRHGYWRALLYTAHPGMMRGDSYSGFTDNIQPALALASIAAAPGLLLGPPGLLQIPILSAMALCQIPMTAKLVSRTADLRYLSFGVLGALRAYARGAGFARGAVARLEALVKGGDK